MTRALAGKRAAKALTGIVIATVLLAGCAAPRSAPAPVEQRDGTPPAATVPIEPSAPAPSAPRAAEPAAEPPRRTTRPQQPAVSVLLAAAGEALAAGDDGGAGARIDRALRVDPADPWVWHALARLHLSRGDFDQARATAERSNALAVDRADVLSANWDLIADAEQLRGRDDDSNRARARARHYERELESGAD